jgi:ATP-dependent RNA helicase RhlE
MGRAPARCLDLRAQRKDVLIVTTFTDLGLPAQLVAALETAGFSTPTPIQEKAIGPQLQGRDILGIAQTGSGKTAAFVLPILAGMATLRGRANPLTTRALILAPTRELAVQIEDVIKSFGQRLTTVLVLGGTSRSAQVTKLARGADIVIATPGRLQDLVKDKKLRLTETRWLVLDEADRMLDMGFIRPVTDIANAIGPRRQTALFSATMAPEVAKLAAGLLNEPVRVEAAPPATTVATIAQSVIIVPSAAKRHALNDLLKDAALSKVLVFARTKHGADRVAKNLGLDGHSVAAIHGNKAQNARQRALKDFASGDVRVLVATDIAARGIDVPDISHVINFELPDDAENYVHRIGRTGRNGASGVAITLCDAGGERDKLRDVERLIRRTLPATGLAGEQVQAPVRAPQPRHERNADQRQGKRPNAARPQQQSRPAQGRPQQQARPQADGKPWWERETGSVPVARPPKGKPRWTKGRKDAARAQRASA